MTYADHGAPQVDLRDRLTQLASPLLVTWDCMAQTNATLYVNHMPGRVNFKERPTAVALKRYQGSCFVRWPIADAQAGHNGVTHVLLVF